MANLKSVKKDIRKSNKHREQNARQKARLRTLDKRIRKLVGEGKKTDAEEVFRTLTRYLDRAGKRNLIHHRQAARRKSRMAVFINKTATASS